MMLEESLVKAMDDEEDIVMIRDRGGIVMKEEDIVVVDEKNIEGRKSTRL